MKKTDRRLMLFTLVVLGITAITACRQSTTGNTEANKAEAKATPAANTNTAPPASPAAADPGPAGSLATPTEAYKTAYDYRSKKDIAGLKRVMSKEVLAFLTDIGKADKKSLDDMLREITETPQAASPEVRNEKVNGDKAWLEYRDEDGEWKRMDFVKEGSEWKMSMPDKDALEPEEKPDSGKKN